MDAPREPLDPIRIVRLERLMALTRGHADVAIGLIDGPVAVDHPELASESLRLLPGAAAGRCSDPSRAACSHGTFIAGILAARRGSGAPALCPACTILVRPIFSDAAPAPGRAPRATVDELASAIVDCIAAGARVLNLSVAFEHASAREQRALESALEHAVRRQVVVVAAAGNAGTVGGSVLTRHPWVIPVVAYDTHGRVSGYSNLGRAIGRHGVGAPGDGIRSLGAAGTPPLLGGTSGAAAFVTGTVALLASIFPAASGAELRQAIAASRRGGSSPIPGLLDAEAGWRWLARSSNGLDVSA